MLSIYDIYDAEFAMGRVSVADNACGADTVSYADGRNGAEVLSPSAIGNFCRAI